VQVEAIAIATVTVVAVVEVLSFLLSFPSASLWIDLDVDGAALFLVILLLVVLAIFVTIGIVFGSIIVLMIVRHLFHPSSMSTHLQLIDEQGGSKATEYHR